MSIKDFRHVEFDEEAVCDALILCPNISRKFGYTGQDIEAIRFNVETHSISIVLKSNIIEITSIQLVALLLSYCRINNIPAPKSSEKNIYCKDHSVIMSFFSSLNPKKSTHMKDPKILYQGSQATAIVW